MEINESVKILRYPGGKSRFVNQISKFLPDHISGRFMEPFVGSAALFLAISPRKSILSDINVDLIDLYKGIRKNPEEVWEIFQSFPRTKKGYYLTRDQTINNKNIIYRSARILYLNRTCFKGMWRHNSNGHFNVGYGGEDRRWVINKNDLIEVSKRLKSASLKCADFQEIIQLSRQDDFLFLDPPYKPGMSELRESHYAYGVFTIKDQNRLKLALRAASNRGVKWLMTNSDHPSIISLYRKEFIHKMAVGTGKNPGIQTRMTGEVIISNYLGGN